MMKYIVSLSAFASTALAAVTAIPSFTLQAVAPGQPFDGMPLTLNGPLAGLGHEGSTVRFYATGNDDNAYAWSLHGFPIGIIDTPAVLVGNAAFNLAFLSLPEQTGKQYGENLMMDNWTFTTGRPSIKIAPGAGKFLSYNFEQRWFAFPAQEQGKWNVMWWDGSCCVTANGIPLKLKLVESNARADS
ncbi:hypothetical protein H072_37 [Dactylellina haptotyla CBS 200.50]|uniref:Cellobiose dehydrogenase cytochrome domain-containing protein n=1 Tax=Dactylellina haptotyla (strain CBS 200.50) TaxID=1284197 RepID=S8ASM4_DACHA|nr:hypothetical protein H072_37 [Dactylellina haptotyla CBS 200.50]